MPSTIYMLERFRQLNTKQYCNIYNKACKIAHNNFTDILASENLIIETSFSEISGKLQTFVKKMRK